MWLNLSWDWGLPRFWRRAQGILVGTGRFELPTCRLGGDRSIHLSYVPTILLLYLRRPF